MNKLFTGVFLFFSTLFSCQQKGEFKSLSVNDFESLIEASDVQRLDVRTLAEYSEGRIPASININVLDDSFGKRSKKAADILSERGYQVFELDKGFNAWQQAGKTIEQ